MNKNNYKDYVIKQKETFKFEVIDKLDFLNNNKTIKNLHIGYFMFNYLYTNIDHYYALVHSPFKGDFDKKRIADFEEELDFLGLGFFKDKEILLDLNKTSSIIETLDTCTLFERGYF